MTIYDFEYDGILLSEMGYVLCSFDSGISGAVSNGSVLSFNNINTMGGQKFELSTSTYEETANGTLQICKNPCLYDNETAEFSLNEFRELMSWLNRKQYHKLRLITEEDVNIYFEASFNVSRIMAGNKIIGAELQVFTNRPFGIEDEKTISISGTLGDNVVIYNDSDEEGYIYPRVVITVGATGNLSILNTFEDRYTIVNNCTSGEVITMDYPIITSSNASHKIQDDFNWNFFRLCKTYNNGKNVITFNSDCDIVMRYSPIVKLGI